MDNMRRILLVGSVLIVLLHVWSAVYPLHQNWGVHFFAFYGPIVSFIALIFAVILFVPKTQSMVLHLIENILHPFLRISPFNVFLILGGLLTILFLLLPARGHLLGDSAIILRTTSWDPSAEDMTYGYRNQPLFHHSFRGIQWIIGRGAPIDPQTVYFVIDGLTGIIFLGLVIYFARSLHVPPLEKVLLGALLFFGAGTQFFFGYVENYVFLYLFTAAYVISAWAALENRMHLIVPLLCFALMIGLHLGALILLPSLLCLIYLIWRERKIEAMIISALIVGISFVIFYISDYRIDLFRQRMEQAFVYDFLPVLPSKDSPYAMFSFTHLIDWLNANMLMGPFRLFVTIVLVVFYLIKVRQRIPSFVFLCVTALSGLLFTFIMVPGLGMARDWDLMASFFIPLRFLSIFLILFYIPLKGSRYILTLIVGLTFLHWFAWIGTNAIEDIHLQRAEIITHPAYMSPHAQKIYYDRLANAFWEKKDYQRSLRWYERYYTLDSANPRIITNMYELNNILGYEGKAISMLQRAAVLNSASPSTYLNLGVLYKRQGDTASAIAAFQHAVQIDSTFAKAHANLGLIYSQSNDHNNAIHHLLKAISYGLKEPILYHKIANSYFFLHEYRHALQYYDFYLALMPADNKTLYVRNLISNSLPAGSKRKTLR